MTTALTDNQVRQLLLSEKFRTQVKDLQPTPKEIVAYNLVLNQGITSSPELLKVIKTNIQTCASLLHKLYIKGYLTRELGSCPSGGNQWIYGIKDISK